MVFYVGGGVLKKAVDLFCVLCNVYLRQTSDDSDNGLNPPPSPAPVNVTVR